MSRLLLPFVAAVAFTSGMAAESTVFLPQSSQPAQMAASKTARDEARKLLSDWIHISGPEDIDGLAWRTMAFAGLVAEVDVVLDGHRMSATQALLDSALTLVDAKPIGQDAHALRNITYALNLIVDGRTAPSRSLARAARPSSAQRSAFNQ
jgi:hypothetical protein